MGRTVEHIVKSATRIDERFKKFLKNLAVSLCRDTNLNHIATDLFGFIYESTNVADCTITKCIFCDATSRHKQFRCNKQQGPEIRPKKIAGSTSHTACKQNSFKSGQVDFFVIVPTEMGADPPSL